MIKLLNKLCWVSLLVLTTVGGSVYSQKKEWSKESYCRLDDKYVRQNTLIEAIQANDLDCVKALIQKNVNPNYLLPGFNHTVIRESAPIRVAVYGNNVEIVKALINAGLDVKGKESEIALEAASFRNFYEMVEVLLKAGVKADGSTDEKLTALMAAAYQGHEKIAKLLIDNGADVNFKDKDGVTAIMLSNDNENIIQLLIKNKADLKISDIDNETAIFYAVEKLQPTKLRILLENGADANWKDKNCLTPLSIAEKLKDSREKDIIIALLKKYGAK